jgi:cytochrome c biogenesis protein CcmG/thiol:disulfide interchange protein DsbE
MAEPKDRTSGARMVGLLALAVVFGLFVLPRIMQTKSPMIGKPAPDFALEVINGGGNGDRLHLSELRGHPVVIDFWASWCDACKVEAPVLNALGRRYKDRGLVVVGVATSDQPGAASRFAAKHGLSYPIVYDTGENVAALYGVSSLPTLVIVDSGGNVVQVHTGYESESAIERIVAPLL